MFDLVSRRSLTRTELIKHQYTVGFRLGTEWDRSGTGHGRRRFLDGICNNERHDVHVRRCMRTSHSRYNDGTKTGVIDRTFIIFYEHTY